MTRTRTTPSSVADGAPAPSALLDALPETSPLPGLTGLTREEQDQDAGDLPTGVDEDALNEDDLDTDQITSGE